MSDTSKIQNANGDASPTTQSLAANDQPRTNRAEINRANAQHSTGPRTDAGKKRSSLNALRHGLTGHTIVLPADDLVAYERHCKEVHDQYRPKNKMEVLLAQMLADLSWRLNRITAIEANMLTLGIDEHSDSVDTENHQAQSALAMAKAFSQQSHDMSNLSMYEQRLSGRFQKTLKQFQDLQATRLTQERSDMYDAAKILQMHKNKKVPYNPNEDGFVFSNADIETYIQRRNRMDQAYCA
jgi:transcription termination factor NusB